MPPDAPERIADDLADEHYGRRQILARETSERARDVWSSVTTTAIDGSWAALTPLVYRNVTLAQISAAVMAEAYVRAMLGSAPAAGQIRPQAFAGVASDGRSMIGLLQSPVVTALVAIARGVTVSAAMDIASRQLGMLIGTQVQDAGRVADGAAVAATEGAGYVRQLRTPSCARCVVLAGQFYRWNDGFLRHPRCDCQHYPSTRRTKRSGLDPDAYFRTLSAADQNRTFTVSGAQAIRDDADVGQVVNARRGMTAAGTLEGTRRGAAGLRGRARLMPEQIYATSSTRAEAVTALRANGFIA